jgi:hypothetical protein
VSIALRGISPEDYLPPLQKPLLISGSGFFIFKLQSLFQKTISPCPTFRSNRDKWGMGVRQSLFPMLTFGAPFSGAVSFPTPFSTASGVFGLVAGPSSAFRPLNFK